MAVRFIVLFFEGALVELLEAEGADKVLRVELAEHGSDAAASDGLVAAGAQRATLGVVVRLAVRQTLVVEERPTLEWLSAVLLIITNQLIIIN